jgi:hypothetical protein
MTSRFPIIQKMKNRYDYLEFKTACVEAGVEVMPWLEYVQKVETLETAEARYPEMDPMAAYLQLLQESNGRLVFQQPVAGSGIISRTPAQDCSGCGGGKVR